MTLFSRPHNETGAHVTSNVISMTTSASVSTEPEGAIRGGTVTDRLVEANERHEVRAEGEAPMRTLNFYAPPEY